MNQTPPSPQPPSEPPRTLRQHVEDALGAAAVLAIIYIGWTLAYVLEP